MQSRYTRQAGGGMVWYCMGFVQALGSKSSFIIYLTLVRYNNRDMYMCHILILVNQLHRGNVFVFLSRLMNCIRVILCLAATEIRCGIKD
ncbi:hypothetical protein L2E82_04454 [Cichorium intybus]|uniref:Uncharacterized protein n=1 Tax=Cichorium intybus TaxID=13427 RepID=A0ACB9H6U4_CICIN|nr:hypothetical protein L2E82_04454 [Cichorium intybus]